MTHTSGLPDPETDPQFYANLPVKRLIAWIVDAAIIAVLVALAGIFTLGLLFFLFVPAWALVSFFYRWVMLAGGSATLGMMFTSIEIRSPDGDKLDNTGALWHTVLYSVIFFIPFGVIVNAAVMLLSDKGQGLHDVVLGTAAINRPA